MGDTERFDRLVMAYYIDKGSPATAKELAEHSGISIASIRKAIKGSEYKCRCVDEYRDVIDSNYGWLICRRRVNAYMPSGKQFREKIIALQKEADKNHLLAATVATQCLDTIAECKAKEQK
jgi:DNA-binding MarR family transcriptional regulator